MKTAKYLPDEDRATRYSLLSRLKNWDDQNSWSTFFDTYWLLIYSVATRSGLTPTEAKDVVQETLIYVAKNIHKFKRDRALGSFRGWLRRVTRWRIADQLKKRARRDKKGEIAWSDVENIPDPAETDAESIWEEEWQANLFAAAVERVKRRVKEEQFQIFSLYVIKRWPVSKIARVTGAGAGRIYVTKHRISALIRKEMKSLESKL